VVKHFGKPEFTNLLCIFIATQPKSPLGAALKTLQQTPAMYWQNDSGVRALCFESKLAHAHHA
jgi:hypothetical protein